MGTMRCKFCGDVYVHDVTSNGDSEDHCTITSALADRVTKLEVENDRLKAELADSLPLQKVRGMVEYCDAHRGDCESYDCYVSCPFQKLCEFLGDLTSCKDDDTVSKLERYVKEVRGE